MAKRKLPSGSAKSEQTLTSEEAIAAIGLVTMAADADIEEIEAEILVEALEEIEVFETYSEEEFEEILNKIVSIAQDEGIEPLLNSAVAALPNHDLREAALMTAMLVVSSDDDLPEEEEDYLNVLQKLLGISDERYDEIIDELYEYYDDEEDEDEDE